jgi:endonuclease/exonuclease/phosphatase family metal-dependent hydrolase
LGELYCKPLVFVGDLNAKPESKPIQVLEKYFVRNTKNNQHTSPNVNARNEIDYIMVLNNQEFEWKDYRVIKEEYASDHLPLFAEVVFR